MTPHNSAKLGEIAKTVILFGDPVRCKRAAEKYLSDCKEVSRVRGALYFTGKYNGKEFTFGTSGMGAGSMGIYSCELFNDYKVDAIIRVGTSGGYSNLNIGDKVLVTESVPDCPAFSVVNLGKPMAVGTPDPDLQAALKKSAEKLGVKLYECRTHSTDIFYFIKTLDEVIKETGAQCVEMESYSLFVNAVRANKKAAVMLSITDTLYDWKRLSPDDRVICCDPLIETVLNLEI